MNIKRSQMKRKIYAYTFPSYIDRDWVKVGDTINDDVMVRIRQQITASNPEQPILLFSSDWVDFRDYQIHTILERHGALRVNEEREWFELPTRDKGTKKMIDVVKSAVNELVHGKFVRETWKMRPEQSVGVRTCVDYFNKGGDDFLFNCKMRFGKTHVAYQVMKSIGAKRTLVLTFKPATSAGWGEDLLNQVAFTDYECHHARD